jgi:hypothetical protein
MSAGVGCAVGVNLAAERKRICLAHRRLLASRAPVGRRTVARAAGGYRLYRHFARRESARRRLTVTVHIHFGTL